MATAELEPDAGDPGRGTRPVTYDPSAVNRLRLAVAFRRRTGPQPDEVFLLDVNPPARPGPWDETPYVAALEQVLLTTDPSRRAPYTWQVRRVQGSHSGSAPDAEVMLTVRLPHTPGVFVEAPTGEVLDAFRRIRSDLGLRPGRGLSHDAALAAAKRHVAALFADVDASGLTVADEEHRPTTGVWAVGLVAPDRTRFHIELGILDQDPATLHVRRTCPTEVVDSVGTD